MLFADRLVRKLLDMDAHRANLSGTGDNLTRVDVSAVFGLSLRKIGRLAGLIQQVLDRFKRRNMTPPAQSKTE
jgi:hypothetical protein